MIYKEMQDSEISKLHPITELEMKYAKDKVTGYDYTTPNQIYGHLYDTSVPDGYKDLVFKLMEGCLANYYKYHKDNIYHINTGLGEADFSIPPSSLSHIFGLEREIMSPQSNKAISFFNKYIPGFINCSTLKKLELIIKNKEIIKAKEKELFKDKDILNYRKMYIKLSSYINFKELDKNTYALSKKNNNQYANPKDKILYTLVTKIRQQDKENLASMQLVCEKIGDPLVPKSMIRNNQILQIGGTLTLTNNTIVKKDKRISNKKVAIEKLTDLKNQAIRNGKKELNSDEIQRFRDK